MANVLITFPIFSDLLKKLKEKHNVDILKEAKPLKEDYFLGIIEKYEAIIILLSHKITKNVIDKGKKLKIISNYAVGYDNIEVNYALQKGIYVTNTPDVLTEATACLTWALILSLIRRIVEGDRFVREGKFEGWKPDLLLGTDLKGKKIGILGLGRIGLSVAKKAKAFGMKVFYWDLKEKKEARGFKFLKLDELLREADIISIHLPLNKDTYHLIDKQKISLMKESSYLINTSRGEVIDEKALIEALKNNKIRGAALDVFENEPKINEELFKLENTVLTPHIGSATIETRKKMADLAILNVIRVLDGKKPLTPVLID